VVVRKVLTENALQVSFVENEPSANQILGHRQLPGLVSEQMELRANPVSSPGGIFAGHATDEGTDLRVQIGPPAPPPRLPAPVETEAFAMPADKFSAASAARLWNRCQRKIVMTRDVPIRPPV
jgi:hypothetical protein